MINTYKSLVYTKYNVLLNHNNNQINIANEGKTNNNQRAGGNLPA